MAARKTRKVRPKAKKARAARKSASRSKTRRPARRATAARASGGAAAKRIAALEAENQRLRDELADLRSQLSTRPEPGTAEAETHPMEY